MKLSVTDQNRDKIEEMLRAVNGRASEHTYNYYTQLKSLVDEAKYQLGMYYESETTNNDMLMGRYTREEQITAQKEVRQIKRFLSKHA